MGMEENTYREYVRMKTEGSGLSSGNISELANECKRKILLRNSIKKITRKEAERESAACVSMGVGRRIFHSLILLVSAGPHPFSF